MDMQSNARETKDLTLPEAHRRNPEKRNEILDKVPEDRIHTSVLSGGDAKVESCTRIYGLQ